MVNKLAPCQCCTRTALSICRNQALKQNWDSIQKMITSFNKANQLLELIQDFHTKSLVGRRFRLRGGYDIEVVAQTGQLVVGNKLVQGNKSGDIRKYKLDHLEYLITKELN